MIKVDIDKKAKTILVEPDFEFSDFKINRSAVYFHLDFIVGKGSSTGCALFYSLFGGKNNYPTQIQVEAINRFSKTVLLSYITTSHETKQP